MPAIENTTPFAVATFGMLDAQAREYVVLIINASYEARPGGVLTIAQEQLAVTPVDLHWGDPAATSIRVPGQMALAKQAVDLIVTGHAVAPRGRAVTEMQIGVRMGDVRKALVVCGDRFWKSGVAGRRPSSPRPFERMPVVYERAFGGGALASRATAFEPRNPVGVGLEGAAVDQSIQTELPNVEYADDRQLSPGERHRPAGLGAIGPAWQPRVGFAGTYDAAWLERQAPLLPEDFDSRFFQVAPPDQQCRRPVKAGDLVQVAGMTPEGQWELSLPALDVPVTLLYRDRVEQVSASIDTVHLEPDRYRIHLSARRAIPVLLNRAPLGQILLGTLSPARLRARAARKVYRTNKGA
jgi:hypothetical protein